MLSQCLLDLLADGAACGVMHRLAASRHVERLIVLLGIVEQLGQLVPGLGPRGPGPRALGHQGAQSRFGLGRICRGGDRASPAAAGLLVAGLARESFFDNGVSIVELMAPLVQPGQLQQRGHGHRGIAVELQRTPVAFTARSGRSIIAYVWATRR